VGNTSRNYHLVIVLTIALASLWIMNLSGDPGSNYFSESTEITLPETGKEYASKLQQHKETPELPTFLSSQVAETSTMSGQPVTSNLSVSDNVAVWGTIQTEYGEITSFDQIVLFSKSLGKVYTTISNLHGYFYIDGVQPSLDYRIRVNPAGMYQQYVRRNVDLSSNHTSLSVVLGALPLDTLRGRVVNSEGMPVPGIGLRVKSALKDVWSSSFITDRSGRFQIENVPLGRIEFLSTFGPDVLISGHVFKGDSGSPISLLVDQGHYQLNGHIREGIGKPFAGANVTLSWMHTVDGKRSVVKRHTRTDASGYFSITDIGPGQHELQLSTLNGVFFRQTVEVVHPELTITINLTAG
jgi:hypothetical protein